MGQRQNIIAPPRCNIPDNSVCVWSLCWLCVFCVGVTLGSLVSPVCSPWQVAGRPGLAAGHRNVGQHIPQHSTASVSTYQGISSLDAWNTFSASYIHPFIHLQHQHPTLQDKPNDDMILNKTSSHTSHFTKQLV